MELRKIKKGDKKRYPKRKSRVKSYILRALLVLFTIIILLVGGVFGVVATVAHGPSITFRDTLVQMAMQASATKWVPGLFLDDEVIAEILEQGSTVTREDVSLESYIGAYKPTRPDDPKKPDAEGKGIEWKDGMYLQTLSYPNFKAYVLLVQDPSRVYIGTSSSFTDPSVEGVDIYGIVKKEGCVAAINGGEFSDPGGVGTGNTPIGVTYSRGNNVWGTSTSKTFIGLDRNNKLVVLDSVTKAKADELGIRDGVCFQTSDKLENVLISNDGTNVSIHRVDDNATSQRTAIGQRQDGTLIFLVTDGRTPENLGATYNDCIDIMIEFGAITAGMLDGGSSSMLYYEKFWEAYPDDYNYDALDRWQKRGLVNSYKAFTQPRQIPTFFCVKPSA